MLVHYTMSHPYPILKPPAVSQYLGNANVPVSW